MKKEERDINDLATDTQTCTEHATEEGEVNSATDEEPKAKHSRPKRRRIGFYGILILAVVFLFAVIGVGTVFLWGYVEAYEDSRIEHVIDYLQGNIDYEYWERSAEIAIASRLTEFESGGAVPIQPHLAKIRDVHYDFRQKTDESTPEAPVYIIRAGARDIGVVRFVPTTDIGYGFNMWEVGSIEFIDTFVDTFYRSIRITASVNAEVEVNGVPVSSGYLDDYEVEYGVTYLIDRIFGDVHISVTEFDGRVSDLSSVENGWYVYPITIPFSKDYNIVIPDDCTVFVDDEPVTRDKITDDAIVPEVFIGAIDPSDIPVFMHRYEFSLSGLYLEPNIAVVDPQGRELTPSLSYDDASDRFELFYIGGFSPEYRELYTGVVEAFIRAYVNFAANVGGNVETNITRLNEHVLRGSELYSRIQATKSAMEWVGGTTVVYNSLTIDNFRPYGDSYFSCEVRYDITNRINRGNRELLGSFEVLFKESGGRWLAVNMMAVGTDE